MKLLKTSFFAGLGTLIQISAGFVINKVVAVYIGPAGLAIIGQFQNFSQIVQTFASGAIGSGVVKYVAESRESPAEKQKLLSTAFLISVLCSVFIGIGLFLLRDFLALEILRSLNFSSIFLLFAGTIIFFSLNNLLLSILNGEKEIKKYVSVNIVSSVVTLLLTVFLVKQYKLFGSLIALVLNQSLVFFVTASLVVKSKWFTIKNFFGRIEQKYIIKFLKYSLMTAVSILAVPIAQILIRNKIGSMLSWADAGYWQAVVKISDVYLLLITTTLSVYYLPRLAELKDKVLVQKEIWYCYKIILPITAFLATLIFLFRGSIINVLFTAQFTPMLDLFKFQLFGDVIKIAAWLLAYIMIAKAMIGLFVATEIIFSASYVLFAFIGLHYFGLQGVTMAFAVNYVLYWFCMIFIYKNYCRVK